MADPGAETALRQLADALRRPRFPDDPPAGPLVAEHTTLADLLTATGAGFLSPARLRVAGHFDLEADIFIVDPALGTLGLVHGVEPDVAPSDLDLATRQRVDQATYLRHLLMTVTAPPNVPYTVECVLVIPAELATRPAFGATLSEIARDTSFLDAVSLSLVRYGSDGRFPPEEFRRGLPWLLSETRTWHRGNPAAATWLRQLRLENYRLPGVRTWTPEPVARVHLLHGSNGTGKSSIAEALELAVTGRIERLREQTDYGRIVRNSHAGQEARITFAVGTDAPHTVVVAGPDAGPALARGLSATAFRLDQVLMDLMTRQRMPERVEAFKAFFPEDAPVWEEAARLEVELAEACRTLPPSIRDEIDPVVGTGASRAQIVADRFAWLGAPEHRLTREQVGDLLPVGLDRLERLARVASDLQPLVEAWSVPPGPEEIVALGRSTDEIVVRLRPEADTHRLHLETARRVLEELHGWTPQNQSGPTDDFAALLNRWLELVALADLADKRWQIARALGAARQQGWEAHDPAVADIFADARRDDETGRIAALRARLVNERDALLGRLDMIAGTPLPSPTGGPARKRLSAHHVRALDAVGPWIAPASPTPLDRPLGQALDEALRSDSTRQFGGLTLGSGDWAGPLIETVTRLEEAFTALAAVQEPLVEARLTLFTEARARALRARDATARKVDTFLWRIGQGRLNDALNELMALFTPARWAYEDVRVSLREPGGGQTRLDFETPDARPAELRLNTAELTLFTVALYVLCAVRAKNPLGLLILDDPLQNLDELSVTTLARGLAKVVRVMPDGWRYLIMLHGEDDLERVRREIWGAVYYLDWLLPSGATGTADRPITLDRRRSVIEARFSTLTGIITALS